MFKQNLNKLYMFETNKDFVCSKIGASGVLILNFSFRQVELQNLVLTKKKKTNKKNKKKNNFYIN